MKSESPDVPAALRRWFVLHFVADVLFAVPLLVMPDAFLRLFGWTCVDPVSSRLVAAALVGIGVESLLGRKGSRASFRTMLRLKVLWSATATAGLLLSYLQGAPAAALLFLAIFGSFSLLWTSWLVRLRPASAPV